MQHGPWSTASLNAGGAGSIPAGTTTGSGPRLKRPMHNDYFLSVWVMLILVIGWESSAPVTKGPLAIGYRYMRGPFSFILKFYLFYLHM